MGNVAVKWTGEDSQMFIGRDSFGHVVLSGSWPKDGDDSWQEWKGLKPSDLLLLSLASCSAYDVVMILGRQRQDLANLYVDVDGKQADEAPYQFTDIHLHYVASGTDLDPKKLERAIVLSEEKYCSVAATISGVAKLTHSFEIR
ncbi:MAG: OsmC family protein [Anaerolineales bacterium]|nr:OsmC family protein [Anaerolineales bacterium]MCB0006912.1 OsmC family protein [Anaerolineales bacterium]MCB0011733.1 OsmC family protein [Anaerolineales bacterium]MCB0027967.1 OsmC family protein [Anaerolineales bacterium]MCB8959789.1 OsmC family protein [Ardenticatenales bacterium]